MANNNKNAICTNITHLSFSFVRSNSSPKEDVRSGLLVAQIGFPHHIWLEICGQIQSPYPSSSTGQNRKGPMWANCLDASLHCRVHKPTKTIGVTVKYVQPKKLLNHFSVNIFDSLSVGKVKPIERLKRYSHSETYCDAKQGLCGNQRRA